ncbi:MAG: hypothetical protein ABFD50_18175 [Smithella sp.]
MDTDYHNIIIFLPLKTAYVDVILIKIDFLIFEIKQLKIMGWFALEGQETITWKMVIKKGEIL